MNPSKYTTDMSPEAHAVQMDLLWQTPPEVRLRWALALSQQVRQMAMDAIGRRYPEFDDKQVRLKFIEVNCARELAAAVQKFQEERCDRRTI